MAQETYRANLQTKGFPFLPRDFGQSVIIPGTDQTQDRFIQPDISLEKAAQVPQVYYMKNVLPTEFGYQSIQFRVGVTAPGGGKDKFVDIAETWEANIMGALSDRNKMYLGYSILPATGSNFLYNVNYFKEQVGGTTTTWAACFGSPTHLLDVYQPTPLSVAYAAGVNYTIKGTASQIEQLGTGDGAHVAKTSSGGYTYLPLTGLLFANGYIVGYDYTNKIHWGSLTTPYDFNPSQVTGAGDGTINGIRGSLYHCVAGVSGFFAFGAYNGVYASYTGNAKYPFSFREIDGCAGIINSFNATSDVEAATAYTISSAGLQAVHPTETENIVPDFLNLIRQHAIEDYDLTTNDFVTTSVAEATNIYTRVAFVCKRYLCISYGTTITTVTNQGFYYTYDYILVFDIQLQRWGKLKIQHTAVFTFSNKMADLVGHRDNIGILKLNGECVYVETDTTKTAESDSIIILGKYQRDRGVAMNLQEVIAESVNTSDVFSVDTYWTLDGQTKQGYDTGYRDLTYTGKTRKYLFNREAYNHSLVIKGTFNLKTLLIVHTNGGQI